MCVSRRCTFVEKFVEKFLYVLVLCQTCVLDDLQCNDHTGDVHTLIIRVPVQLNGITVSIGSIDLWFAAEISRSVSMIVVSELLQ